MKRVLRLSCFLFPAALAGCASSFLPPAPADALDQLRPEPLAAHIRFLADPALAGRMTGTAENSRAGDYLARHFALAGLTPAGDAGGWFQPFPADKLRVPAPSCRLQAGAKLLAPGKDFAPMAAGCAGAFEAPLVFAGYGLKNHIRRYDDYSTVSARGAVVMILQGEPHDKSGRSRWAIEGPWTELVPVAAKLRRAADNGAVAVLLVSPPDVVPGTDPLDDLLGAGRGPLPAIRISRAAADELLAAGGPGRNLAALINHIHTTNTPSSFAVGTKVSGVVNLVPGGGRNVVGVLPAVPADPAAPAIVVAAHYDHIPATGQKSRDHLFGSHPGADDNASGTAALVQLARAMARLPERRCRYYFVAFSGEEIGFLGSRHFVRHPPVPLSRIALDITLDEIGRVRDNNVYLIGNVNYQPVSLAVASARPLARPLRTTSIGILNSQYWSDQAPFVAAGVRTLLVFAGLPPEYHTRLDTADRVNYEGMANVAHLVFETLRRLDVELPARAPDPPPAPDEKLLDRLVPDDAPATRPASVPVTSTPARE